MRGKSYKLLAVIAEAKVRTKEISCFQKKFLDILELTFLYGAPIYLFSVCLSFCAFYFKNRTWYGYDFWCKFVHIYVHIFLVHMYFCFLKILIYQATNQDKACLHSIIRVTCDMIVIFGTQVQNNNAVSIVFIFGKFRFFWATNGVKGAMMAQSNLKIA